MTSLPSHTSVLIVGAGPSGLMMAAQLLRNGIHPVIIDAKTAINNQSRALVVQARSLEIFRQMEVDDLLLQHGNVAKSIAMHKETGEVARLDIHQLGEGKSPFPYILVLEQSKTEKILVDYLTANACPIFWNTWLIDFKQSDENISVRINRDGEEEEAVCDWVVGADGASSKVRNLLNIPFSGGTYQQRFYLADVRLAGSSDEETIRIFLKNEGFAGVFPMQGESVRFIGVLPKSLESREEVSFADIKPYLTYTLDTPISEKLCNWFSTYRLHHKMAEKFRVQRCFLIGDAAHVHSPAGGQGMNTGLQDAYNLAWKLSGVIKKEFNERILESYSEERMPVAKSLLQSTDKMFSLGVERHWLIRKIRNLAFPFILKKIWKNKNITDRIFSLISQTGIGYRESRLSVHHSQGTGIKAGDRLPYVKFFDEKKKLETDLHKWCCNTGFTLLVLGWINPGDVMLLAKWIKQSYPFNLNFYYLPYSEKNKHLFELFEVEEKKKKALVIRPDLHIGYMSDAVVIELLETYLKEIVGWKEE